MQIPHKSWAFCLIAASLIFIGTRSSFATTYTTVPCISSGSSSTCLDHQAPGVGSAIFAQGYVTPGDGGGGQFADIGACDNGTYSAPMTEKNFIGDTKIYYTKTGPKPTVGSAVTSGTIFPPGTVITDTTVTGKFTVSIPITSDIPANTPFTIGGNGGTLIISSGTDCFQKADYRGDPHEWGAVGDGSKDDSTALQEWLGYTGPWVASIPATYMTNWALSCWPYVNLQATANNSRGVSTLPLVHIAVGTSFPMNGTVGSPVAVLTAYHGCRISGLSVDANYTGTCNGLGYPNCYIDAVDLGSVVTEAYLGGGDVVIDGHSLLQRGYHNLNCPNLTGVNGNSGGQIKDSQLSQSYAENVVINCANVRIIGDIIELAGSINGTTELATASGIVATGEDLTVSNGNISNSAGIGIWLNGATYVSVTGMFLEANGNTPSTGGAGIEIDGVHDVSICGNHFKGNDYNSNPTASYSAQIRFGTSGTANPTDVSLCGNVYKDVIPTGATYSSPNYVYDVLTGVSDVSKITLYENPVMQDTGVFSPRAGALASQQVLP
ncbi:MAG TPA: hypothetical protein VKR31_13930 [Rhizomicrobium sp.]|nr:hypothetical protein [Rhizomicrobium sp.]